MATTASRRIIREFYTIVSGAASLLHSFEEEFHLGLSNPDVDIAYWFIFNATGVGRL